MKKITLMIMSIFILLCIGSIPLYAEDVSNYIIMGNIPPYERFTQTINPFTKELKTIPGYWIYRNAGVLIGADHFQADHMDVTYKTEYQSETIDLGMEVQVTQHAGGDSDRWLLHEAERGFRDTDNLEALPDKDSMIRVIDNNKIFFYGGGVVGYRWIRNNIVVNIQYTNLSGPKPEPLEVVKAYLAKYPSTITMTDAELKASAHNVKWIKDEMDRRLWLCDKWNAQFQAGKTNQKNLISNLSRNMSDFLNYRQKYYKGIFGMFHSTVETDLNLLFDYKRNNDVASIQKKLTEYKVWWAKHKDKSISLN